MTEILKFVYKYVFYNIVYKGMGWLWGKFKKLGFLGKLAVGALVFLNSFIFLPNNWELQFSGSDVAIRFGHGKKFWHNSAVVANFGCETLGKPPIKKYRFMEAYMGSDRRVIPLEIFTFIPALIFKENIGPWKWYEKQRIVYKRKGKMHQKFVWKKKK